VHLFFAMLAYLQSPPQFLDDLMAAAPEGTKGNGLLVVMSMGHHFLNFPWHYFKPRFDALRKKLVDFHVKLPEVM
jgi:hypothetical protein